MLYDPSTETVEQILKDSAALLLDVNATVASSKALMPWFRTAWRNMVNEFSMHSIDEMEKTVDVTVPVGSKSFGPNLVGVVADYKTDLLVGMQKFEPPLYINIQGFRQELKSAQNLADFNVSNRFVYRLSSSVFHITPLVSDTTFSVQFYSKLVCPASGPVGINYVTNYLMFKTAYLGGLSDGNIAASLKEYDSIAEMELQRAISILVGEEGPITPGLQDIDQNDGSRRFVIRSV
jgi:hypothetical protein